MGFDSVHQVIRERVNANRGSVFVAYPNAEFTIPNSGPWIRVSIVPGETRAIEMGGTKTFRQVGVVVLQLFDNVGKGDGALLELADTLTPVLRSVIDSGVTLRTPSLSRIGPTDGGWYQMNLTCPYHADEQGA